MEAQPDIYLLAELLYLSYIISYLFIISNQPISTTWKVVWFICILLLPIIGAFFFHNTRQPRASEGRRRFRPDFRRNKR